MMSNQFRLTDCKIRDNINTNSTFPTVDAPVTFDKSHINLYVCTASTKIGLQMSL